MGLFVGKGSNAIEVAVARKDGAPSRKELLDCWKAHRAGRAAPVLVVVLTSDRGGGGALCGASGEEPPVYLKVDEGQLERLCREALDQPDRHAALRFLALALPSLETALPGLNNEGLVALHALQHGAPKRDDWEEAKRKAGAALQHRDRDLLSALGFQVERLDNLTNLLRSGEQRTALAVMLREKESPEAGTKRFNSLSPVSYALSKADTENLSWVVLVQGNRLRLYSTVVNSGVGRRGRTETYVECQPSLLADEHLPYLWLLFSAEALGSHGSLTQILNDSERFAGNLAQRLRERIYDEVVPILARGIAGARALKRPGPEELERTYEMALTVLFRLLFIAYAEDRDLLPYHLNDVYRRKSLKQKARELADLVATDSPVAAGSSHWQEVSLLWQAVAEGNSEWGVPAYDGGLFSKDAKVSPAGAKLVDIVLPNITFEAVLRALLVIESTDEGVPGPVDFRSLGVREFGTIYEGLLESELAVADTDMALDHEGVYVPAKKGDHVVVESGGIYLHNRSGARKSSGSYYTKHFAVEHLLDGALKPALSGHFSRLDEMDDSDAAEAFFDFRIADIAMGSGHFLIAAIDRIESGMAHFMAKRNLPGVRRKLSELRDAALHELGELSETTIIEDGQLLRRLIARRCIYGVDLNALSVQLARLAVWIHTFVPGLPLSVLDHTLVRGNSLVGIGTVEYIREKFKGATDTLFSVDAEGLLGKAAAPLRRLANINDTTLQDIAAARKARHDVREAISHTEALCDLITAGTISNDKSVIGFSFHDWGRLKDDIETSGALRAARRALEGIHVLHFPIAFPEVFLRPRPGFDVILGNPPWKEVMVDENAFWARHFPGLRSRSQSQRQKEVEKARLQKDNPDLVAIYKADVASMERVRRTLIGAYPGMGTGDPDLYKAFCWRFWHLTMDEGGQIGVVLPRGALSAKGSTEFRLTMLEKSACVDIAILLNNRGWVFDEVDPRYTIGLVCISRGTPEGKSIRLRGPYASLETFRGGIHQRAAAFERSEVLSWNEYASLPLLPLEKSGASEKSGAIFAKLRKAPRLDLNEVGQWRVRPDSELHAALQKPLMDLTSDDLPKGFWLVYKGESFNLWTPDTGKYYAYADPEPVTQWLQNKRVRGRKGQERRPPHGIFSRLYT